MLVCPKLVQNQQTKPFAIIADYNYVVKYGGDGGNRTRVQSWLAKRFYDGSLVWCLMRTLETEQNAFTRSLRFG